MVCFREPGRERVLAVEAWTQTDTDLVGYWHCRERELTETDHLPGHRPAEIAPREFFGPGAAWELRYDGEGTRMHALALGLGVQSGRTWAVHWLAWDIDWQGDLDKVNVVLPSFSPPPPGR